MGNCEPDVSVRFMSAPRVSESGVCNIGSCTTTTYTPSEEGPWLPPVPKYSLLTSDSKMETSSTSFCVHNKPTEQQ